MSILQKLADLPTGPNGNTNIVDFLIKHGANIDKAKAFTPLGMATLLQNYDIAEKLLLAGAKVSTSENDTITLPSFYSN